MSGVVLGFRARWSAWSERWALIAGWLPRAVARAPTTIHIKLISAFLVIVALLIAVGAVGLQALSGANRNDAQLVALDKKLAIYRQLQKDTANQLYAVSTALLAPDPASLDTTLRQLNLFTYDLERLQYVAPDEVDLYNQVSTAQKQLIAVMTQVISLARAGQLQQATDLQLKQAAPLADNLERLSDELVNRAESDSVTRFDQNQTAFVNSQWLIVSFAAGSILLALVLGFAIAWSVIAPVRQINTRLSEIASGDFATVYRARDKELRWRQGPKTRHGIQIRHLKRVGYHRCNRSGLAPQQWHKMHLLRSDIHGTLLRTVRQQDEGCLGSRNWIEWVIVVFG